MKKVFNACVMLAVLALAVLAILVFTGCATRIELRVQRTPALNTLGIQRIAIMPFEIGFRSNVYRNAAQHATLTAISRIQATNHFTLVSSTAIDDARRRGESIENYVDALFTGQILSIEEKMSTREGQYKDSKTGEIIKYIDFIREVDVEFSYSLVRARDGSLLGPIVRSGSYTDTQRNAGELQSMEALAKIIIDNELRLLHRDVVPYTINISRSLEKEKNKELKPQMEAALAHVKGTNYLAARQAYLNIWEAFQSVAAAVNASILYEATGDTRTAANFMQRVLSATESPLARNTLARLNRELSEQAGVERYEDTRNLTEKTSHYAFAEIQKILPQGARLWIYNNAASNHDLVNNVIDNMTAEFLGCGITVIERQMIDLVIGEQNFHLSGNVSDDEFVSIGNLAGANTVIVAGISGSGAGRRLQIRVLDIRSGALIMQSGTGSEWNL